MRVPNVRAALRFAVACGRAAFCCGVAHPARARMAALLGLRRAPRLVVWSAAVVLAVALAHATFFGAGRYGLIVAPFVTALAFVRRGTPMPPVASASVASSAR